MARIACFSLSAAAIWALPKPTLAATTYTWNVSSGSWGTTTNWNPNGMPGSADTALFSAGGTVASTVDNNYTIAGLTYTGTSGTTTLSASSPETLTVGNLNVAYNTAGGGTLAVGSNISLSVGSGSSNTFYVGTAAGTASTGTLNLSSDASFTANVGNFFVGVDYAALGGGVSTGTLSLGASNAITATDVCIGGTQPDQSANANIGLGYVTTASNSTTTISTPTMIVGAEKSYNGPTSSFTLGTGATLTLGSAIAPTALTIGSWTNGGVTHSSNGLMDLSAGTASLYLNQLYLGHAAAVGDSSYAVGTLNLSSSAGNTLSIIGPGTLTPAALVQVGYNGDPGNGGSGTLNIGNLGTNSVITSTNNSTAILIGYNGSTGSCTGAVTLGGGNLTITTTGSAISGSTGTSTLNLGTSSALTLTAGASSSAWIQNVGTATIGSFGVTFNTNSNNITIPQSFTGTGGTLATTGAGTLTLTGTNTYTGGTTISNSTTLWVNNSLNTTSGTGTGTVAVNGGTLGGSGYIGTSGSANGAITVANGASIAAGADSSTIGTLTSYSTNGVTFQAGSNYAWKVSGTSGDLLAANKLIFGPAGYNLSSGSPFTIYVTGSNTQASGQLSYTIATSPGAAITLNGSPMSTGVVSSQDFVVNTTNFTDSNAPTTWQLDVVSDGSGQDLVLVASAPEPGSLGLLGLASLGLLRRRRS